MRVLVVEDDTSLRRGLAVALRSHGLRVHDAADAGAALRAVQLMEYDVILLDLGLPDEDGLALLPRLRRLHPGPIIVLSARRDQSDKVAALDGGADDYVTKPFGLSELLARIRAQARRAGVDAVLTVHGLVIDLGREQVTASSGELVPLTAREWAVLAVLARAAGAPVSVEHLLEEVWAERDGRHRNYVRQYVNLLRRKLEVDPTTPRIIRSAAGRGYWLDADARADPDTPADPDARAGA